MNYIAIFLLGLCFGSFVNALVWRIYKQEQPAKKRNIPKKDLSILHGRSMCTHCKHVLAAGDLVPVLSWVALRGKCRYCGKKIGGQYPLVELTTALLFVYSYAVWPGGHSGGALFLLAAWPVVLTAFMALVVYDIRWMLLPNRIVFPLTGYVGVVVLLHSVMYGDFKDALLAAASMLIIGGLFYALYQISDGRWIGGGDVKLGFSLGLMAGEPTRALLVIFLASLFGTIVSVPMLASHKMSRRSRLAFGPFLMIATVIVVLHGQWILDRYSELFLFSQ